MQVNSAQDYLTQKKRQILSKQYVSNPGYAHRRNNTVYTSLVANKQTQRVRFIVPIIATAATLYSSQCCVENAPASSAAGSRI
jgi:hypothetical protein